MGASDLRKDVVRLGGLEPPTPTLSVWCSNRLSYKRRRQLEGGSPYQRARRNITCQRRRLPKRSAL